MIINSLEKMEAIVSSNRSLSWEGWDVVELVRHPGALFKPNGVFYKGSWHFKNRFSVDRDGWRIPKKYVR
jgi:hypothetical protein